VSHGAKIKRPLDRVAQAGALAVVFGLMFLASRAEAFSEGASGLVTGIGFLLLAGMLTSELLEIFGLPHLTGYLLAGAVAGPHVLHLVEHDAVVRMQPVNTLALALIALGGGVELKFDLLKQVARSLFWSTVLQCVVGIVGMTALFFAIGRFLPFLRGYEWRATLGVAFLWGVMAVSRSPSATLGIFAQVRPDGPVSRFSLAFVMTSDVVVAILVTLGLSVARPLIEPGSQLSLASFGDLGHEILGSVSLGTTLGLLLALYLWLVGSQLLVVLIALGFGLTEGLHYLRFDPLLTFMVAGFVVQNFSQQGPKLLEAIDRAGSVVFVVFFATAGAHLDIPLLRKLWPVALYLAGTRGIISVVTHWISCRIARDEDIVKKWAWSCLVSQAGLTLGISVMIEKAYPSFGAGFRALAVATVAINELVGPILFKTALDRSEESGKGAQEKSFHAEEEALEAAQA
jgi:Kef-type K+ transport system membrane component KefB